MPTGLTAGLYEGEQSFRDFAVKCAGQFGVMVEFRDEPNAVLPEEFIPDTKRYDDNIAKAWVDLDKYSRMSDEEAEIEAQNQYDARVQSHKEDLARRLAIKERYVAMLERAKNWVPPSKDHEGLKRLMIEQLEESIRFDCEVQEYEFEKVSAARFRAEAVQMAQRNIDYYTEEKQKVIERAKSNTQWAQALYMSIAEFEAVPS